MTRDPVDGRGDRAIDWTRRLDAGAALAIILVLGLAVRVFVAGVLLPQSGLSNDIGAFTAWGQRLAAVGPGAFYEPGYFADYPPGYLYVLWLLGTIGGALAPLVGTDATSGLVKIPGITADIGVAWMLFAIARRWPGRLIDGRRFGARGETLGLAAATIYLFSPGVVFDSAVWGQIDSVGTLILLATIYALARGWTEAAALGAVVAALVKFQFAFLVPVVLIVGLKRHLFGRSSDRAHDDRRDPLRVLTSLSVGLATLAVVILPFGMTLYAPSASGTSCFGMPAADPITSLVGKFCEAANTYAGLSINAFNVWRNPWSELGGSLFWGDDTTIAFVLGGIDVTWQVVGTVLFAVVALVAFVAVARRDDLRGVLLAALVLAIAFFVLPTRVHERYLFPALALVLPLLYAGRSWPWIAAGLHLSFFLNIYWVYTEDWSFAGSIVNPGVDGRPMPQDGLLAATLLSDPGVWIVSFGSVLLLGAVVWHLRRHAAAPAPATDDEAGMHEPVAGERRRPVRVASPVASGARGREPGWLAPNPADALLREPMRRLDRRDALLLLGLVVFALLFRLWRLDEPPSQHFDEVYHGRSATEFLSSWQEGWDRDVYEWTHPMLAKYLIAGGMLVADPNSVAGETPTDVPVTALAVAPERSLRGWDRSITFSVEGETTIVARDAETGDELVRWQSDAPITALATDVSGSEPVLLAGSSTSGTVVRYELDGLLVDGATVPTVGEPIDTGLADVVEFVVPTNDAAPVLVRGEDGVAAVERGTTDVRATAAGRYGGIGFVEGVTAEDETTTSDTVAVTDPARGAIVFLEATTLEVRLDADGADAGVVPVDAPLVGPLMTRGSGNDQLLLAVTGPLPQTEEHPATEGGIAALDADAETVIGLVPLPGAGTLIGHNHVAGIVYVAGTDADGMPVVWTHEPHIEKRGTGSIGLGAFDTTALPGDPVTMAFDLASTSQSDDHERLIVATDDGGSGSLVAVDAGSNAFAWRIAGIVFGAGLVGLVYLLAATMFSRRRVAVLAAAFVAIDGMSYVMSRISMNDIFVAFFIVAAYLLFWQIWSGRWRRSAWWVLPSVGVLIGLAAATKWVGFYALGGLLVLVLARSALGRLVLVVLAALVTVVGGIGAPWPFLVLMIGVLALALLITWVRPIRIDRWDALTAIPASVAVLAAIAIPFVLAFDQIPEEGRRDPGDAVEYLFGLLARGAELGWPAFVMLGIGAVLLVWRAVASWRDPSSDARWWRPGELGGFAWSWAGVCLVVIPLTVYALSYVPYLQLGHDWAIRGGPNYAWSLEELHAQMFGYHFNLQDGHPSSSPWWSWPLALKPTWFYADNFDNDQIAVIYNGGNPVLFWAGVPALFACAVLAWKRRSMALVLLVAAFAFQFVPWIRIERASFAYHYLTAVIFAMVAVAYVVDELLRRPAWRDVAIGYLVLVAVAWALVFPLGSALAVPDWYVNAARVLPPWNYSFQFPEPPSGDRADLVSADVLRGLAGLVVAAAAAAFALGGRTFWDRRTPPRDPLPEGG